MSFGEILRGLIEENDLTQKQLSLALNITQSTLGGYVQGVREPDFETLKLFARYFGVSTDYLLGYDSEIASVKGEAEIMRLFRSLSEEQRELYIEQGKAFIRLNNRNQAREKK